MTDREHDDGLDASFIISQTKSRTRFSQTGTPGRTEDLPSVATSTEPFSGTAVQKDEVRRRKGKGPDYESLFIRNAPTNTRSGKTVYIRKEFHERITRIVQVIGRNELSLFSYLDNVLEHHFATYQEDISELYKQRNNDIF